MTRWRFYTGGYIDVQAETAEQARELLTASNGAPRAFIEVLNDGKIFVYTTASGNAPVEQTD